VVFAFDSFNQKSKCYVHVVYVIVYAFICGRDYFARRTGRSLPVTVRILEV